MNIKDARTKSVIGHIVFFCFAIAVLVGLYMHFHNAKLVMFGGIALFLAHIAIVLLLLYFGGWLLFRKLHAHPVPHQQQNEKLETKGLTISWAFFYDILMKGILLGKDEKLREWIVDFAGIQPGEKVLDVGCGTGSLAITAKLKTGPSAEIYGIDAANEMIERAQKKAAKAGVEIGFKPGLVESIAFKDNTFDVVLSSLMVHHLPGDLKTKAFAEIYRVLKPGGRLLIIDFEPPKNPVIIFILSLFLDSRMMKIDNSKVPVMLEEAGFCSLRTGKTNQSLTSFVSGLKPV